MPPELEWLANITNPQTRCTYNDVGEFLASWICGNQPRRAPSRAHVIAWRKHPRGAGPSLRLRANAAKRDNSLLDLTSSTICN